MTKAITIEKFIAIEPIPFSKVEAKVTSGIATVAQRTDVVVVKMVMDFEQKDGITWDSGKCKVILRGDAGFQPWNKTKLEYNGKQFVLCPFSEVIAFEVD